MELHGLEFFGGLFFDFSRGDLSQSHNHFAVVALDERLGPFKKLPGPLRRQNHQLEAAVNLLETILHGNSSHIDFPPLVNCYSCQLTRFSPRSQTVRLDKLSSYPYLRRTQETRRARSFQKNARTIGVVIRTKRKI